MIIQNSKSQLFSNQRCLGVRVGLVHRGKADPWQGWPRDMDDPGQGWPRNMDAIDMWMNQRHGWPGWTRGWSRGRNDPERVMTWRIWWPTERNNPEVEMSTRQEWPGGLTCRHTVVGLLHTTYWLSTPSLSPSLKLHCIALQWQLFSLKMTIFSNLTKLIEKG